MLQYSNDLLALYAMASQVMIWRAHLFAIGPCLNGAMLYATDGRYPITYEGNVYQSKQWGFWSRGDQTTKIGWDSNKIDLTLLVDQEFVPSYFPGTNDQVYMMDGIFDGMLGNATPITIYRATMSSASGYGGYGTVVGPTGGSLVTTRFVGELGDIRGIGPTKCTITANDILYRLNMDCPKMLIQAPCRWVLYSPGCTLLQSNFTRTDSVLSVVDPRSVSPATNLTTISPAGTFAQGSLIFTSGANNGIRYNVSAWTPGGANPDVIQLDATPIYSMSPGDTFSISQGCNKTFASCEDLQGGTSNAQLNFGGTPLVPVLKPLSEEIMKIIRFAALTATLLVTGCSHLHLGKVSADTTKIPIKSGANTDAIKENLAQIRALDEVQNKIAADIRTQLAKENQPVLDAIEKATPALQAQLKANTERAAADFKARNSSIEQDKNATMQKLNVELGVAKALQGLPENAVPGSDDDGKTFYFTIPPPRS